jgi:hypothetical protein
MRTQIVFLIVLIFSYNLFAVKLKADYSNRFTLSKKYILTEIIDRRENPDSPIGIFTVNGKKENIILKNGIKSHIHSFNNWQRKSVENYKNQKFDTIPIIISVDSLIFFERSKDSISIYSKISIFTFKDSLFSEVYSDISLFTKPKTLSKKTLKYYLFESVNRHIELINDSTFYPKLNYQLSYNQVFKNLTSKYSYSSIYRIKRDYFKNCHFLGLLNYKSIYYKTEDKILGEYYDTLERKFTKGSFYMYTGAFVAALMPVFALARWDSDLLWGSVIGIPIFGIGLLVDNSYNTYEKKFMLYYNQLLYDSLSKTK